VHVKTLSALLAPHAGRLVVGGVGIVCFGAVDRYLGMLTACSGDVATASRWFESAAALEQRIGAEAALARTQYWWARTLLGQGGPRRAEGVALLARTRAVAENLGMTGLVRQVNAVGPS
jgi:hypothetical protein